MRSRSKFLAAPLAVAAVFGWAVQVFPGEDPQIAFDAKGLSSIVHNGAELVKAEDPRLSVDFGKSGAKLTELCPEVFDAYAKAHPMTPDWPDRRPIIKHWDVGYSTVVYWIQSALDEALTSLTSQTETLGKDAWKRWWQAGKQPIRAGGGRGTGAYPRTGAPNRAYPRQRLSMAPRATSTARRGN